MRAMKHEYHRYEDKLGFIHKCEGARMVPHCQGTYLVWTICGRDVPANRSYETAHSIVTCPLCIDGWRTWCGGRPPVAEDKPITVNWGSYQRTYERADMVAWHNLPRDGRYKWRI